MSNFDLRPIQDLTAEPIVFPSKARLATKITSRLVAGAVSATVVSIIHQNTTTYSKAQAVKLYVGAAVLGAMAADKAAAYITDEYGEYFVRLENYLWIPIETDVSDSPEPTDLEVLIAAIPDKQ